MPIAGIPEVLENLIVSVFKSHQLKTWNIYQEQDGNVTFKLRFNMQDMQGQGHGSTGLDSSFISYRRKTERNITRDRQRAVKRRRIASDDTDHLSPIETDRGVSEVDFSINVTGN